MAIDQNYKERQIRNKAINLTTSETTDDNKAYIIDRRLLDMLLNKYTKGTIDDLKHELHSIINEHSDKDKMFEAISNHIYCNNVANAVAVLDEKAIEDTFEAVAG